MEMEKKTAYKYDDDDDDDNDDEMLCELFTLIDTTSCESVYVTLLPLI